MKFEAGRPLDATGRQRLALCHIAKNPLQITLQRVFNLDWPVDLSPRECVFSTHKSGSAAN